MRHVVFPLNIHTCTHTDIINTFTALGNSNLCSNQYHSLDDQASKYKETRSDR